MLEGRVDGQYRIVVASDKAKVGIRFLVAKHLAPYPEFLTFLSREKISRIKHEIAKMQPHLVLVLAALDHKEEENELWGFVRKSKIVRPKTMMVIHGPVILGRQMQRFFEVGADAWINEKQPYQFLGATLKSLLTQEPLLSADLIKNPYTKI